MTLILADDNTFKYREQKHQSGIILGFDRLWVVREFIAALCCPLVLWCGSAFHTCDDRLCFVLWHLLPERQSDTEPHIQTVNEPSAVAPQLWRDLGKATKLWSVLAQNLDWVWGQYAAELRPGNGEGRKGLIFAERDDGQLLEGVKSQIHVYIFHWQQEKIKEHRGMNRYLFKRVCRQTCVQCTRMGGWNEVHQVKSNPLKIHVLFCFGFFSSFLGSKKYKCLNLKSFKQSVKHLEAVFVTYLLLSPDEQVNSISRSWLI